MRPRLRKHKKMPRPSSTTAATHPTATPAMAPVLRPEVLLLPPAPLLPVTLVLVELLEDAELLVDIELLLLLLLVAVGVDVRS